MPWRCTSSESRDEKEKAAGGKTRGAWHRISSPDNVVNAAMRVLRQSSALSRSFVLLQGRDQEQAFCLLFFYLRARFRGTRGVLVGRSIVPPHVTIQRMPSCTKYQAVATGRTSSARRVRHLPMARQRRLRALWLRSKGQVRSYRGREGRSQVRKY